MRFAWFVFFFVSSQPARSLGAQSIDLVDVMTVEPRWTLDIRYATTDNFTKKVLYPTARCLLRPTVARMLLDAQKHLDRAHPGFTFRLKDCYRPRSVQVAMWKVVEGTSQQSYVANPYGRTGSVHNYGAAVDLTLNDSSGLEVDMGTPYDSFQRLAQPRYEQKFLKEGKLTKEQVENRRRLRDAMLAAGFKMIRNEWWHFDAFQGKALRERYRILDVPLDSEELPGLVGE